MYSIVEKYSRVFALSTEYNLDYLCVSAKPVAARSAGGAGGNHMTTTPAALQTDNQTTDQNKTLPALNGSRNERTIKI